MSIVSAAAATPRRMYVIGGAPGAGKSSVSRLLARRHGLWAFHCDWHQIDLRQRCRETPDAFPAHVAWNRKSLEEHWVTSAPEEMAHDVLAVWRETIPLLLAEVDRLPPGPVVVEGVQMLPASVLPLLENHRDALWLLPMPAIIRQVREERHQRGDSIALSTSDPVRALRNIIERDILIAAAIAHEAERVGARVVEADRSLSVDVMVDVVEHTLGLTPLERYVGCFAARDGRRLVIELHNDVLLFGRPERETRSALEPRGDHIFRVAEGLFTGECLRFEINNHDEVQGLLAASAMFHKEG